jgi:hypothetical protein
MAEGMSEKRLLIILCPGETTSYPFDPPLACPFVTAAISICFGLRIEEDMEGEARRAWEGVETGASRRKNCREEMCYSQEGKHLTAVLKVMSRQLESSNSVC